MSKFSKCIYLKTGNIAKILPVFLCLNLNVFCEIGLIQIYTKRKRIQQIISCTRSLVFRAIHLFAPSTLNFSYS